MWIGHELITPGEAAEYMRVNPETVRRWLREGRLPGRRAGSDWRVLKADVDAWLQGDQAGTLTYGDQQVEAVIRVVSVAVPSAPPAKSVFGVIAHSRGGLTLSLGATFSFAYKDEARWLVGECVGRFWTEVDEQVAFAFLGGWQEKTPPGPSNGQG